MSPESGRAMSLINIREKSNETKSIKERYNLFMIPNTCQGRYEGCDGQGEVGRKEGAQVGNDSELQNLR